MKGKRKKTHSASKTMGRTAARRGLTRFMKSAVPVPPPPAKGRKKRIPKVDTIAQVAEEKELQPKIAGRRKVSHEHKAPDVPGVADPDDVETVDLSVQEGGSGPLPVYGSMQQCSGATGIPIAILKRAKKSGSDAFHESGRVHLDKLLRYLFAHDDPAELDWDNELKKWQAKREKIKHDQAAATVVDRSEVRAGIFEAVAILFSELDRRFCSELPGALKGLDERSMRARAQKEIQLLKDTLRKKFEDVGKPAASTTSEPAA
jgi:hypothetical protein